MRMLWRSAAVTSAGTAGRLAFILLANKLLAIATGPAGIGFVSLFRQASSTLTSLATLGGPNGVVQGVAAGDGEDHSAFLKSTARFFLAGALAAGLVLLIGGPWLAELLLGPGGDEHGWLVRLLAVPVVLGAGGAYFESVVNGNRRLGQLALSQVSGAFVAALFAFPVGLALKEGRELPVVFWLAVPGASSIAVSAWFCWRNGWLSGIRAALPMSRSNPIWRRFLSFSPAMLTAIASGTIPILAFRSALARQGLEVVGFFDAAWTLGAVYLAIILSSFGTFYFPQLATLRSAGDQSQLAGQMMRFAGGVGILFIVFTILAKSFIISLVYTPAFAAAASLLRWTLVGDYFRLAGWVVGMPMQANGDARGMIISEAAGALMLASVSFALLPAMGFEAIGVAYLASNIVYMLGVATYVGYKHGVRIPPRVWLRWLFGLAVVGGATWNAWGGTPEAQIFVAWLVAAFLAGAALLGKDGWPTLRRASNDDLTSAGNDSEE